MAIHLPKLSPLTRRTLTSWANEQFALGVSCWAVCDALLEAATSRMPGNEVALLLQVERELSTIMVERNQEGSQHEKAGQVDEAIRLYEANLRDEFKGSHPYERLRIIYTERKDYENAIRVCEAYLKLPPSEYADVKWARFAEHPRKLIEKKGIPASPAHPTTTEPRRPRVRSNERGGLPTQSGVLQAGDPAGRARHDPWPEPGRRFMVALVGLTAVGVDRFAQTAGGGAGAAREDRSAAPDRGDGPADRRAGV